MALGFFKDEKNKHSRRVPKKVVVSVGKTQAERTRSQVGHSHHTPQTRTQTLSSASMRDDLLDIEKELARKEIELDQKLSHLNRESQKIEHAREAIAKKEQDLAKTREDLITKLEKVSSLTREESKKLILENLETQLQNEVAKRIKEAEEKIKAEAQVKAKEILVNAMLAGATDWVAEYTVSTVKLESDEIKGRIIGKEGRNIRAFELATGVDVELESDVEGEVRLSSFDPVRREIARLALEWLVKDARIQPTRIEQLVEKAQAQVAGDMADAGRQAAHAVGLFNLPQEALDTLGRLKFRYSYGQNQLIAAVETAKIAKKLAQELGTNDTICAMGGMFHDIGKTQVEKEGTHVQLGVELAKKWNFPKEVVDCIAQHHEDEPFSSVESVVVHLADAVSGARPGARHESVEDYMRRLGNIEKLAASYEGVEKAYAIQAGREVRVIVNPVDIDDAGVTILAHNIKKKLEDELTYPGQITITVIREVRAVDVAK